jgi:hypothetical protein
MTNNDQELPETTRTKNLRKSYMKAIRRKREAIVTLEDGLRVTFDAAVTVQETYSPIKVKP